MKKEYATTTRERELNPYGCLVLEMINRAKIDIERYVRIGIIQNGKITTVRKRDDTPLDAKHALDFFSKGIAAELYNNAFNKNLTTKQLIKRL